MLKTQDPAPPKTPNPGTKSISVPMPRTHNATSATPNLGVSNPSIGLGPERDIDRWQQQFGGESPQGATMDDFNFNSSIGMPMDNVGEGNFTWEMIGLGLEEPLPPQETIDELHQVYFEKVHPSMPMIHRYRYLAAMNLYVHRTHAALFLAF